MLRIPWRQTKAMTKAENRLASCRARRLGILYDPELLGRGAAGSIGVRRWCRSGVRLGRLGRGPGVAAAAAARIGRGAYHWRQAPHICSSSYRQDTGVVVVGRTPLPGAAKQSHAHARFISIGNTRSRACEILAKWQSCRALGGPDRTGPGVTVRWTGPSGNPGRYIGP